MEWCHRRKTSTAQVEDATGDKIIEVGIEAEEERQAHHKDKMEIGSWRGRTVKPHQTVVDIVEHRLVGLLPIKRVIQKFGYKHTHRELVDVERQG